MNQVYRPSPWCHFSDVNAARSELPFIQKIINKKLSVLGTRFKCSLRSTAIAELLCIDNTLTMEFRHNAGGKQTPFIPSTHLGERAARVLNMPAEIFEISDEDVFDILRALILEGFPEFPKAISFEEALAEASLLAWMMLEPVRRIVTINRREAE